MVDDDKWGVETMENKKMIYAELKPCPFCGEIPLLFEYGGTVDISCQNDDCPCRPSTQEYLRKEYAIKAWNRRAEDGK